MDNNLIGVYSVKNRDSITVLFTGSLQECEEYILSHSNDADLMIVSHETTEEK